MVILHMSMNINGGTRILNISDPANPVYVGGIVAAAGAQQGYNAADISKWNDTHAIISLRYYGVKLLNVSDPTIHLSDLL